jgi:hypothetical protein
MAEQRFSHLRNEIRETKERTIRSICILYFSRTEPRSNLYALEVHLLLHETLAEQSVRILEFFADLDRWDWFAAGDKTVAKSATRSGSAGNSAQRILFEIGMTVGVPLGVAALIALAFVP